MKRIVTEIILASLIAVAATAAPLGKTTLNGPFGAAEWKASAEPLRRMPSGRNTALMIETYWHAYRATKKETYRAKALSIANNFTRVQQEHNGDYPTMFTKYPMNFWINNAIYPARVMVNLQRDLEKAR